MFRCQKWGFLFEGRRGYSRGGVIKFYWAKLEGGFSRGGGIVGEGLVESLQYVMTNFLPILARKIKDIEMFHLHLKKRFPQKQMWFPQKPSIIRLVPPNENVVPPKAIYH